MQAIVIICVEEAAALTTNGIVCIFLTTVQTAISIQQ